MCGVGLCFMEQKLLWIISIIVPYPLTPVHQVTREVAGQVTQQTADLPAYRVVVLRLCDKTGCVTTCETEELS